MGDAADDVHDAAWRTLNDGEDELADQYDDTNRGVLFKNDKGGNDKRPDYRGKVNVNGEDFELAGWIKKSRKGETFLSLSVQEPRDKGPVYDKGSGGQQDYSADLDDAIPF